MNECKFEKWFSDNGYDEQYKDGFRIAWDAAIEEAAKVVDEAYDFMEPWIHPNDIRALAT